MSGLGTLIVSDVNLWSAQAAPAMLSGTHGVCHVSPSGMPTPGTGDASVTSVLLLRRESNLRG